MTTPAGWYPDPDGSGGQRYWDGNYWTEHLAPALPPPPLTAEPAAAEPVSPPAVPEFTTPDPAPVAGGAHRAPETPSWTTPVSPEPPAEPPTPEPAKPEPLSWTPPPMPEWDLPSTPGAPSWDVTPTPADPPPIPASAGEPEPSWEPTPYEPFTPPPFDPEPHAVGPSSVPSAAATAAFPQQPADAPPAAFPDSGYGAEPTPAGGARKKLIRNYIAGVAAGLIAVLALSAWAVFGNHGGSTVTISAPSTSATATATASSEPPSFPPPPPPQPGPGDVVDGDMTFTVTGVDTASNVTSPTTDYLSKDAQGQFIIVHLKVVNPGPDVGSYMATQQKLNAGGTAYESDPEATFYVGTIYEDVNPGSELDTSIVFDVPAGTPPDSIELHGAAGTPGVVVPLQ